MSARRRVWIDSDAAVTAGNGEVDDAFALIQALNSPELDIVGVSAVFGNCEVDHSFATVRDILARAGREDVRVYRGCGVDGERAANEATEAIGAALAQGPLTIAALGPLTSIAAALGQADMLRTNVTEIVFVGGRRSGVEFRATPTQKTPFRDMNFECDAAAAAELLALEVPMTLAGWDVSAAMWLTPDDLDRLDRDGGECARWLVPHARRWQSSWQASFGAPGFTPFDTLAIGWLTTPDCFAAEALPTRLWHDGARPLFAVDVAFTGPMVTFLASVDYPRFHADLMARLLG